MAKAKGKGGLGRGLGALMTDYEEISQALEHKEGVIELELDKVFANPDQPRKNFDEDKLMDLTESIKEHGVLQPILVTARDDKYMIIAGERRYRAAKAAGLSVIPALIRDLNDEQVMEIALIENVQRDDLSPIEEAKAYDLLQRRFGYTQEHLAQRMGKSRSAIANNVRLLALPEDVQQMVDEGKLTVGHVRPLLSINVPEWQSEFAHEIIQSRLSVREVEKMVKSVMARGSVDVTTTLFEAPPTEKKQPDHLRILQDQLSERFSTKVNIKKSGKGGKVVIDYYDDEDLKRICEFFGKDFY